MMKGSPIKVILALLVSMIDLAEARVLSPRIVGGDTADPTRYPYYTALNSACGGSLIWPDVVLSAAHCFIDNPDALIMAYVNRTMTDSPTAFEYPRTVEAVVFHPNYNPATEANDVMLLKLSSAVDEVTPVMLNTVRGVPADGEALRVFGFGDTTNLEEVFPSELQVVDVNAVSFEDCNDEDSYDGGIIDDIMLCGGVEGGGKDSCQGDSGGPIVVAGSGPDEDVLVGLSSFGVGCGEPNFPGVYARVSSYVEWIQASLCELSDRPPPNCLIGTSAPVTAVPTTAPTTSPTTVSPSLTEGPFPTLFPTVTVADPTEGPTVTPFPTVAPFPITDKPTSDICNSGNGCDDVSYCDFSLIVPKCRCIDGFFSPSGLGGACKNRNECHEGNHFCDPDHATCIDQDIRFGTKRGFKCECNPGFKDAFPGAEGSLCSVSPSPAPTTT